MLRLHAHDEGISPVPRVAEGEPLIRFRGVRKAFGRKVIFSDLTLDILRGETITIVGVSGSGKSVLLKMLIGLLKPDAGEILFDGRDVARMRDDELTDVRRRIAYLFQGSALFDSLTVGENVAYGLREQFWKTMHEAEIRRRIEQSLALVGLPGIDAMRPSDLSGGMRKRVALARTLALQPEVILYDEPSTGLDPINTARINRLIVDIQRTLKLTSIVVTHDMGTVFVVSDRLAMIGGGRIVLVGSKDDFRNTPNRAVRDFIDGHAPETEDVAALLSSS
jgi:phospholipid/cholesterol/gamma-HCH transport system ATP-binding protein